MAGKPGKSGGARPGAGRPPKEKPTPAVISDESVKGEQFDPLPTLEKVARGLMEVTPQQYKALTALLPYVHGKKGEGGKKEEVADKAKRVAGGKFAAAAPPRLAAANGKKV